MCLFARPLVMAVDNVETHLLYGNLMKEPKKTKEPKTTREYIESQIKILTETPECGTTHYNLAVGLIKQQKWDDAAEELMAAINECPTLGEAYVALGGISLHKGDLGACIRYNKAAIEVRPKFSQPYGNLGFVYLQQGQPEAALEHLEKAVSLNPQFIQAYSSLASAYFMLGRLDESIAAAKKALALEPTFAVAHNNLAVAYFEQGAYNESIAHCDKALEYGFEVNPEFLKQLEPHR